MAIIQSQIDKDSKEFAANDTHMRELVADLQTHLDQVELGGGEKSRNKHTQRGKMLPRERVKQLLDPGTPFLELSPMAAFDMYEGKAPLGRNHYRGGPCQRTGSCHYCQRCDR